jgi:MFS family permease
MPVQWQAYAIVAIILIQGFPTAIMFVAFQILFTELVPRRRMAAVVGMRNVLLGVTSTIMVLVCGVVLTRLPFPWGYQTIFLLGFFASLGSVWAVARLRVPADLVKRPVVTAAVPATSAPVLWRDQNFVRFAAGAGVLHLGMFMTAPLFPLYWVDTLKLSDGWISILVSTLTLTSVLGAFGMRTLVQRWNLGVILGGSSLLFALYPILTSMLSHPWLLVIVTAFSGIWGGVINVALFNALTEVCPPQHRARYIGVFTWLMNIGIFAAPLVGAALAQVVDVEVALVVAGGLRVLAAVIFFRFPFNAWDQQHEATVATVV